MPDNVSSSPVNESAEKSAEKVYDAHGIEMMPQPHGGALRRGGNKTPGTGRPAAKIRRRLQRVLAKEGIKLVEDAIAGKMDKASASDRLRAVDLAARYGIGMTKELTVEHVRERLQQTIQIIEDNFAACKSAEELLAMIEPVWK